MGRSNSDGDQRLLHSYCLVIDGYEPVLLHHESQIAIRHPFWDAEPVRNLDALTIICLRDGSRRIFQTVEADSQSPVDKLEGIWHSIQRRR